MIFSNQCSCWISDFRMDEHNAIKRRCGSRPILGNITNQIGNKRPFSSILGNPSLKSVDKGREKLGGKFVLVDDGETAKRVCVAPPPPCNKISSSKVDVVSGISNIPNENQDPNLLHVGSSTAISKSTIGDSNENSSAIEVINDQDSIPEKISEATNDMDGLVTGVPVQALSGTEDHDAIHSCEINEDSEGTESDMDPDEQGFDNLVMSQSGSVDFARLPESQESRVKLDTCVVGTQTCEDNSGLNASIDSIKACSCSFCTKAANIWLDLHYQDIKGRISAIKKSQKDASILVDRSCRGKGIWKEGPEKNIEASNLESSLMGQWKSLFQHMEHIFQHEAEELEGSLVTLTDLRERCKADLDSFTGTPENC
ncbi:uncharacterized protein LOC107783888 isoform X1 [Nicotiana tabacum]|uniref:Uncharacterized protein LOC107783888 isoform X1 n=2 Tax=Nicotiana tabacum TaxID=4097 RepID=A0AC58SHB5_TOBAC|nr:uncharacterized protein LOC104120431 isoform X1 [Nicotiana tomentosiformis]